MSTAPAHATVDVGATCTHYLRIGAGPSVLVIGRQAFETASYNPFIQELSRMFRVIVPDMRGEDEPSPGDASPAPGFATWLREFLDGLGALEVSVVAYDDFALRALSFGLTDPLRVHCLVLFYEDGPDPMVRANADPEPLGQSQRPVLLRRHAVTEAPHDPAAIAEVVQFLLGDARAERRESSGR